MGTASDRSLLSERKARRDERNAQRLAGMFPMDLAAEQLRERQRQVCREIQALKYDDLPVKVTSTTRWS